VSLQLKAHFKSGISSLRLEFLFAPLRETALSRKGAKREETEGAKVLSHPVS
jgi:hypothetical protein